MPKYAPGPDEMDDSYGAESEVKPPAETQSVDEENADTAEILISKSKVPGLKEGDTCTFRVTKDFGDEMSLEYVKPKADTEKTSDDLSAETDNEIGALDTQEI